MYKISLHLLCVHSPFALVLMVILCCFCSIYSLKCNTFSLFLTYGAKISHISRVGSHSFLAWVNCWIRKTKSLQDRGLDSASICVVLRIYLSDSLCCVVKIVSVSGFAVLQTAGDCSDFRSFLWLLRKMWTVGLGKGRKSNSYWVIRFFFRVDYKDRTALVCLRKLLI